MTLARFANGSLEFFLDQPLAGLGDWLDTAAAMAREENEAAKGKGR